MTADRAGESSLAGKLSLLALVILLIVFRRPELFTEPRFWAEEGAVYFEYAWHNGFFTSLFSQHLGYYALVPTLTTAVASLGPLALAPLVTTVVAALFQVVVSAIVIFGTSPYWDSWPKKLLLALGIQLLNPYEIWLTTICTQFWMTVAVFLVFLAEKEQVGRGTRMFYRGIVLIGGLSGGQAMLLFPVFAVKAWRSRSREDRLLTAILAVTILVQLAALAAAIAGGERDMQSRFAGVNFDVIRVLTLHLVNPFVSQALVDMPAIVALDNACARVLSGVFPNQLAFVSTLAPLLLVCAAILVQLLGKERNPDNRYIVGSFLCVAVFSTLLSVQMSSSPRYAYAPAIMLVTLQLGGRRGKLSGSVGGVISALFLTMVCIVALRDIREPSRLYFKQGLPVWRNELARWQQDPAYKPMIWPPYMNRRWDIDLQSGREK